MVEDALAHGREVVWKALTGGKLIKRRPGQSPTEHFQGGIRASSRGLTCATPERVVAPDRLNSPQSCHRFATTSIYPAGDVDKHLLHDSNLGVDSFVRSMRRKRLICFFWLLALPADAQSPALTTKDPAVAVPAIGIDHIPLVVKDLEAAADTYRRLGFAIKPGRLHSDGIRNAHVKFEDGAGIELITAPGATDALTERYRRLLSQGEGPAYVGFHTSSLAALSDRLNALKEHYSVDGSGILEFRDPELQWLFFFEGTNRSPTDRPEDFAHLNTANATIAVWIVSADQTRMLSVFRGLGARVVRKRINAPDPVLATVARVSNGEVVFLRSDRQVIRGRPMVGATFRTADLSALRRVLPPAVLARSVTFDDATHRSLFVSPLDALGMWLEFREQRRTNCRAPSQNSC